MTHLFSTLLSFPKKIYRKVFQKEKKKIPRWVYFTWGLAIFFILFLAYIWYQASNRNNANSSEDTPEQAEEEIVEVLDRENQLKSRAAEFERSDQELTAEEKQERANILERKAEFLVANNEYTEALVNYERVLKLSDNNPEIERKIPHIAFEAKHFERSIELYKKYTGELSLDEKVELLWALRYTYNDDFLVSLVNLDVPVHIQEAMRISWTCEHEYISCEQSIKSYAYDYNPINNLKDALQGYENIGIQDTDYKEALLVGALYKNKDYTTAIKVGETLLKRKADYRPVLKIVGFSSYMINALQRWQGVLAKYKKLEPKDPEADFMLGLIHFDKGDFDTSNIYFNRAVLGGYKPKIVVERKLTYNYHLLNLPKNMFQVLSYLVQEEDVTESDMANAIYLALEYEENRNANEWIRVGLEKFPDSKNIQALGAWYQRITGNISGAESIVNDILSEEENHLISLVQAGIISYDKWDFPRAKILLERAKFIDAGGSWDETISKYLAQIPASIEAAPETN